MRRAFFFLGILAGCASAAPQAPARPLRDFRGIIHCHSLYSHDSRGTYEEILAAAKAAKVDFICMTDHPPKGDPGRSLREGWTGLHDGVLFIQGAEYGDNILGLGLTGPIQFKDRRGTIQAIHEQGGVAIACHPEGIQDWSDFDEADGMEIYNVHAAVLKHKNDVTFAAKVVKKLKEDPEHSFQLLQELDGSNLETWDRINLKRRFAGVAGNDSHQNVNFLGYQLDPYPRAFKFVSTHVLAPELTREDVLEALRTSRCYVAFDILGDPGGFAFGAGGSCAGAGGADPRMPFGSEVTPGGGRDGGTPMVLAYPGPATHEEDRIRLEEGGKIVRERFPAMTKGGVDEGQGVGRRYCVPEGLYRVIIYRTAEGTSYPWIIPNPIYIGPKRP